MDNKQLQQETNLAIVKASELAITNNKDFELAGAMLVELKTYAKRVEEYWAEPKKSAHKSAYYALKEWNIIQTNLRTLVSFRCED